jgi:predicted AAA+ superfamily ATPase
MANSAEKKYPRWLKSSVKHALKTWRVVVISGPRQSGKTTLVKQIFKKAAGYRSMDDAELLNAAAADPIGFLKHGKGTMVIDEIQKAPMLLPAIKRIVDGNNAPGQFLITGSADVRSLPEVSESLAGRVANIRLRTFAAGEFLERKPTFFEKAFAQDWPMQIRGCDKETVINLAFRGGYPEIVRLSPADRRSWHLHYINSLLERDLRDITNIKRHEVMTDLLYVLTAWSGKLLDIAGICGKLAVSRPTLESYVNVLASLCLFERLGAWVRTDYEKAGRKGKLFAADTGLMASILNWRVEDVMLDPDRSGKIAETFVYNELAAQLSLCEGYRFYHYRDREDREIDFIIENDRGALLGVEVKAGSVVSKDDFKHMVWFKHNIVPDKEFIGIVLYSGENALPFGPGFHAVPTAALWS